MYVKLVVGSANVPAIGVMRDICLLLTSSAPSVADIIWCDADASLVIDSTPAGWTYAGGTGSDATSIDTGATIPTIATNTLYTLGVSAPCIDDTKTKYAAFNILWLKEDQSLNNRWTMIGAEEVASDGTMTNGGGLATWGAGQGEGETSTHSLKSEAGDVFHIVATERGITIVQEGRGLVAVWETNETSVHTLYDQAPFVQYSHAFSGSYSKANAISVATPGSSSSTATSSGITTVFNVRDVVTGVVYGTYDPTNISDGSGGDVNRGSLWQNSPNLRKTTLSDQGLPLYQVSPIFFQCGELGYPVQYVSGINPIYWTAPYIGTSGDTITIGVDDYIWLNAGEGFGVAVGTS